MESASRIEAYFLKIILRISLLGTLLITCFDFVFKRDELSHGITGVVNSFIIISLSIAFVLFKKGKYNASVIVTTLFPSLILFYSSVYSADTTTTSMVAIITLGFFISILLDGLKRSLMHVYIISGFVVILCFQFQNPSYYLKSNSGEVIVMFVVCIVAYIIITYSASVFKDKYNSIHSELSLMNQELVDKTVKMEQQNKELIESENQMNEINAHLEQIVEERTNNVKSKNAYLVKYAFANAHHVRGPLARILGLLLLSKMETETDYTFLFNQIEKQANEIDEVLKTINKELEEGQDIFF